MYVDLRRDQVSLPVVTCSEHIFSLSLHTQDLSDYHCNERGLLGGQGCDSKPTKSKIYLETLDHIINFSF